MESVPVNRAAVSPSQALGGPLPACDLSGGYYPFSLSGTQPYYVLGGTGLPFI
jgi:hypothetical protein